EEKDVEKMEKNEREDTEDNGSWEEDEINESHQRRKKKVGCSYLGNSGWGYCTWRWAPARLFLANGPISSSKLNQKIMVLGYRNAFTK
ncbi:12205_t:CDS:1, partial [Funneliformis mosseae]